MPTNPVDLTTVAFVKAEFEPSITTATRDAVIQEYVTAASIQINYGLDRELTPQTAAATRRFYLEPYDLGYRVEFAPYDCRDVSSVTLNPEQTAPVTLLGPGNTLTASTSLADFNLEPLTPRLGVYSRLHISPFLPIFSVTALRLGRPMVDVTGDWGIWQTNTVPTDVQHACAVCVRSWMRQNPAAYAFADNAPVSGDIAPAPATTYRVPESVWALLAPYKRWSI